MIKGQSTSTMMLIGIAVIALVVALILNWSTISEIIGNLMDSLSDFVTTSFLNLGKR